jgi:hypothetical protein
MTGQGELHLKASGERGRDIFLCHTGADKPRVERLAECRGALVRGHKHRYQSGADLAASLPCRIRNEVSQGRRHAFRGCQTPQGPARDDAISRDPKTLRASRRDDDPADGPNVQFVQLDDLSPERLDRVRPAAFIIHSTSPGNHQAWIAVSGLPAGKEVFKDFMRRVRKAVGGNDKSASGAARLAGTENF